MKTQRLLVVLTFANAALLMSLLIKPRSVGAEGIAPVLRGRAFEIVDDRGQVRASISVLPADPAVKMPDGTTGYPETVLLRLINSKGRPNVKIEATEIGASMALVGDTDPTHAFINTKGTHASFTLTNKDGRQQTIKP